MDGATFQGELVSLSETEAKFTTGDGEKVLPLNELMLVELDAKNIEAKEGPEVTLTNGSLGSYTANRVTSLDEPSEK